MNTSNNSISQSSVENQYLPLTKKNINVSKYGFIDIENDYHQIRVFNTYNKSKQTYDLCLIVNDKHQINIIE